MNEKTTQDMTLPWVAFLAGIKAVSPLMLGVFPFALISGIAAIEIGLSATEAIGMAVIVFAGASQLAAVQLLAVGAPALVILVTTGIVNLRFLMYSASISPYLKHLPLSWKSFLAYILTDQAYALSIVRYTQEKPVNKRWYYLGVAVPMWTLWQIGTAIGVFLGNLVPSGWSLDFAIPLTFLALLVPTIKSRATLAAAVASGVIAVAAGLLPYNLGLMIAAFVGIAIGLLVEGRSS